MTTTPSPNIQKIANAARSIASSLTEQVHRSWIGELVFSFISDSEPSTTKVQTVGSYIISVVSFVVFYAFAILPDLDPHWIYNGSGKDPGFLGVSQIIRQIMHSRLHMPNLIYDDTSFMYTTCSFYLQLIIFILALFSYAGFILFQSRQFFGPFYHYFFQIYADYLSPMLLAYTAFSCIAGWVCFIYTNALHKEEYLLIPIMAMISLPSLIISSAKAILSVSVNNLPYNSTKSSCLIKFCTSLTITIGIEPLCLLANNGNIYFNYSIFFISLMASASMFFTTWMEIPFHSKPIRVISQALSLIFFTNQITCRLEFFGVKNMMISHYLTLALNIVEIIAAVIYEIYQTSRFKKVITLTNFDVLTERGIEHLFTYSTDESLHVLGSTSMLVFIKTKYPVNFELLITQLRFMNKISKHPELVFFEAVDTLKSSKYAQLQSAILVELCSEQAKVKKGLISTTRQRQLEELLNKCHLSHANLWLNVMKNDINSISRCTYELDKYVRQSELFFKHLGINKNSQGIFKQKYINFQKFVNGGLTKILYVDNNDDEINLPDDQADTQNTYSQSFGLLKLNSMLPSGKKLTHKRIKRIEEADRFKLKTQDIRKSALLIIFGIDFALGVIMVCFMIYTLSHIQRVNMDIASYCEFESIYTSLFHRAFIYANSNYYTHSPEINYIEISSEIKKLNGYELPTRLNRTFVDILIKEVTDLSELPDIDAPLRTKYANRINAIAKEFDSISVDYFNELHSYTFLDFNVQNLQYGMYGYLCICIPLLIWLMYKDVVEMKDLISRFFYILKADASQLFHMYSRHIKRKGKQFNERISGYYQLSDFLIETFKVVISYVAIFLISFFIPNIIVVYLNNIKYKGNACLSVGLVTSSLFTNRLTSFAISLNQQADQALMMNLDYHNQILCIFAFQEPKIPVIKKIESPSYLVPIISSGIFTSKNAKNTSQFYSHMSEVIFTDSEVILSCQENSSKFMSFQQYNTFETFEISRAFYNCSYQEFLFQTKRDVFVLGLIMVVMIIVSILLLSILCKHILDQDHQVRLISRILITLPRHSVFDSDGDYKRIITLEQIDFSKNVMDKLPVGFIFLGKNREVTLTNPSARSYYGDNMVKQGKRVRVPILKQIVGSTGRKKYFTVTKYKGNEFPYNIFDRHIGCQHFLVSIDNTRKIRTRQKIKFIRNEINETRTILLNACNNIDQDTNKDRPSFIEKFVILDMFLDDDISNDSFLKIKEKLNTVTETFTSTLFISSQRNSIFILFGSLDHGSRARQYLRDAMKCTRYIDAMFQKQELANHIKMAVYHGSKCIRYLVNNDTASVMFYSPSMVMSSLMLGMTKECEMIVDNYILRSVNDTTIGQSDRYGSVYLLGHQVEYKVFKLGKIPHDHLMITSKIPLF